MLFYPKLSDRPNAAKAGQPDIMAGHKEMILGPSMTGMAENSFINRPSRSFIISAELDVPNEGAKGMVLSGAGSVDGSSYVKDNKLKFAYNWACKKDVFHGRCCAIV